MGELWTTCPLTGETIHQKGEELRPRLSARGRELVAEAYGKPEDEAEELFWARFALSGHAEARRVLHGDAEARQESEGA